MHNSHLLLFDIYFILFISVYFTLIYIFLLLFLLYRQYNVMKLIPGPTSFSFRWISEQTPRISNEDLFNKWRDENNSVRI